jgi:DoxX-like protein
MIGIWNTTMSAASLPVLVAWSIAAVFALAGLVNVVGPVSLQSLYARWNYPHSFRFVAGTLQLLAAAFLLTPQTRVWGVGLAASILFVAIVTLLSRRHYAFAASGMVLLAALPPTLLAATL